MHLLFITRKYPPMVGGMESLSYALANEFPKLVKTTSITWGKSQRYLPIFLPWALLKALFLIPSKRITHVHLGDALLSPLGLILKALYGVKTSVTACGLDITYKLPPYQMIVPRCAAHLDKIICISQGTLGECLKRGIPKDRCAVIPCGVYPEKFRIKASRKDLERISGIPLANKKVLITVGRLVERKGVYWFIKNVFPKLGNNYIYLVAGDGPERERISNLITDLDLGHRVLLLGRVSDDQLKVIYNTADLFVMPNVPVEGDIEGFGIVALEASSAGLPVIASDLEGIKDAIIINKSGLLLGNDQEFHRAITNSRFPSRKAISSSVRNKYSWSKIADGYMSSIV